MSEVPEVSSLPAATLAEVMALVLNELRRLARRQPAREHRSQILRIKVGVATKLPKRFETKSIG